MQLYYKTHQLFQSKLVGTVLNYGCEETYGLLKGNLLGGEEGFIDVILLGSTQGLSEGYYWKVKMKCQMEHWWEVKMVFQMSEGKLLGDKEGLSDGTLLGSSGLARWITARKRGGTVRWNITGR
mmetsp:Transcript_27766/g.41054  ORF Transcript_27766/g.41054 Transcript_27766/m.41054 type:complete len:124 (+) Transcript_27766:105-476(+)